MTLNNKRAESRNSDLCFIIPDVITRECNPSQFVNLKKNKLEFLLDLEIRILTYFSNDEGRI